MIIPDHKKITTVILSRMKNGKSVEMPVAPEESLNSEDKDIELVAQDMMQALSDKSIQGLKDSLKSLMALIDQEDANEEEGE